MSIQEFRTRLAQTAFFAYLQHILRLVLRMVWLFIAGWLAGWGAYRHLNILQDERWWWVLGVLFAVGGVLSLGLPGSSLTYFAWRVDRRLGYGEQFSAVLELDEDSAQTPVAQALLAELSKPLKNMERRVRLRGWYLLKDAEALLIVSILLFLVGIGGGQTLPEISNVASIELPPLGAEPGLLDIFPSTIPGIRESAAEGLGSGLGPSGEGQGNVDLTQDEFSEIGDALAELGVDLSEFAATDEAGEALQLGDYESAADALENLAEEADELTPVTRAELAEMLDQAADQIQEPGQKVLFEGIQAAVEGLESDLPDEAGKGLDQFASALDDLAKQDNNAAKDEEFSRLQGQDDDLVLSVPAGGSTYLQSDAQAVIGENVVLGATDYVIEVNDVKANSVYSPYDLDWNDRDVVEEYFSPQ